MMIVKKLTSHLVLAASISLALAGGVAQAADKGIEIQRDQIQADILGAFAPQLKDGGGQLAGALKNATDEQLLAAQKASTIDEVNAALGFEGTGSMDGSTAARSIRTVGDVDKDFTFTPVTPCRLVDTREAGGPLSPNEIRAYFIYGNGATMEGQGGVSTGCLSPDGGEPYGAILSITTVGQSGEGTLNVYPANEVAPTFGTVLFYKTTSQIITNTTPVRAFRSVGEDIRVKNKFGSAHFVIDVLGYYYASKVPVGVEYDGVNTSTGLSGTATTVRSIDVTTVADGHCVINASGNFNLGANSIARCSITTGSVVDPSAEIFGRILGAGVSALMPMAGTRGFPQASGSQTYNLVCERLGGSASFIDPQLTATCTPNRY